MACHNKCAVHLSLLPTSGADASVDHLRWLVTCWVAKPVCVASDVVSHAHAHNATADLSTAASAKWWFHVTWYVTGMYWLCAAYKVACDVLCVRGSGRS
jgi:hypothetical protein